MEQRLEQVLAALHALDVMEAARLLNAPLEGPATPRAMQLWQACVDAMPRVLADWHRRAAAQHAASAYLDGEQ